MQIDKSMFLPNKQEQLYFRWTMNAADFIYVWVLGTDDK